MRHPGFGEASTRTVGPARGVGRAASAALLLVIAALAGPARAGLLTDVEKNAFVVGEAAAMTASMLEDVYGLHEDTLQFSSTSFSATGWTVGLTGSYAGESVALNFMGTFSPGTNMGSYTVDGLIGLDSYSGMGDWSYVSIDAVTDGLNFNAAASVLGLLYDRHTVTPKLEVTTDDGITRHTVSQGKYYKTFLGVTYGRIVDQTDDSIGPSGGGGRATVVVSLIDDGVNLSGMFDQGGGQISGTLSIVPEPSTWTLATAGLIALAGYRRCRRPRR